MKKNNKYLGLVTKKFNEFFLVDLKNQENFGNMQRFLCKVRKSINFKEQSIYWPDQQLQTFLTYILLFPLKSQS